MDPWGNYKLRIRLHYVYLKSEPQDDNYMSCNVHLVMALRGGAAGSRGPAAALMAILFVRVLAVSLARFWAYAARVLALPVPCVTARDRRRQGSRYL